MMAIQVIEDRFSTNLKKEATTDSKSHRHHIRRPTRGIVIKDNNFASLKVMTSGGKVLNLTDAGGEGGEAGSRTSAVYSNFLLQTVSEERVEKQQILETFGEPYIFFFGERPRIITFGGILLNTFDFNWEAEWWENYEKYLRGTKCVENDAQIFMTYDETLVSGYIISSAATKNSNDKNFINFQFSIFLTGYATLSALGDGTSVSLRDRANARATATKGDLLAKFGETETLNVEMPGGASVTPPSPLAAVPTPSLASGLAAGLWAVIAAFDIVDRTIDMAVTTLTGAAQGDIIRMPGGIPGTLVSDYGEIERAQTALFEGPDAALAWGPVTYSEFNNNVDEYVDEHNILGYEYSSRNLGLGNTETTEITAAADAQDAWAQFGFETPFDAAASLLGPIVSGAVGMYAAGNTEAWQVAEGIDQALTYTQLLDPGIALRYAYFQIGGEAAPADATPRPPPGRPPGFPQSFDIGE